MNSMATNVLAPFLSRMDQFILFLREGLNNDEQSSEGQKQEVKKESNDDSLKPDSLRPNQDTSTPLSGSENEEDLRSGTDDNDEEDIEGTIFRHRLDTSFPLSGGETDDDLDRALE